MPTMGLALPLPLWGSRPIGLGPVAAVVPTVPTPTRAHVAAASDTIASEAQVRTAAG